MQHIEIDSNQLANFCERWQVSELALFGSVLRKDFREDSDVDVLVSFLPDARIGLIALSKMQIELAQIIGRRVDLVTKTGLKPLIRDEVISQSETLYAA